MNTIHNEIHHGSGWWVPPTYGDGFPYKESQYSRLQTRPLDESFVNYQRKILEHSLKITVFIG